MDKSKPNYKIDKKTGHVLEIPSKKQVRSTVKQLRDKRAKEAQQEHLASTSTDAKSDKPKEKKVFDKEGFDRVGELIKRMHQKAKLPDFLTMARRKYLSTVCVINKDAKRRELLPDKPDRHVMLCHGKMARVFTNQFCLIVKIQKSFREEKSGTEDGNTVEKWQDGSWSIVPCSLAKSNYTTIQEVRRRPWFFLHRYWYEITFNGRVQPAMMLNDYHLHPDKEKQHFYVTREYVKVRNQDAENDYFRFWLHKPTDYGREEQ